MKQKIFKYIGAASFVLAGFFLFNPSVIADPGCQLGQNCLSSPSLSVSVPSNSVGGTVQVTVTGASGSGTVNKTITMTVGGQVGSLVTLPTPFNNPIWISGSSAGGAVNAWQVLAPGTSFNVAWNYRHGDSATMGLTIWNKGLPPGSPPVAADSCGNATGPVSWGNGSLTGSHVFTVANCMTGYAYEYKFTVSNSLTGQSDTTYFGFHMWVTGAQSCGTTSGQQCCNGGSYNNTCGEGLSCNSGICNPPGGGTPVAPVIIAQSGASFCSGANIPIAITWSAVSGATSYKVKRSSTVNGPKTVLATVTSTSYTDSASQTSGYYVVSAVSSGGESPDSNIVLATYTVPTCAPTPTPTGGGPTPTPTGAPTPTPTGGTPTPTGVPTPTPTIGGPVSATLTTPNPLPIPYGTSAVLNWSIFNSTSATLSSGGLDPAFDSRHVTASNNPSAADNTGNLTQDTTYVLTAQGIGGPVVKTLTITVLPQGPTPTPTGGGPTPTPTGAPTSTPTPTPAPPGNPNGFNSGAGVSCAQIKVTWTAPGSGSPTGYVVLRSTVNDSVGASVAPGGSVSSGTFSFVDSSPLSTTSNYYWVEAVYGAATSAPVAVPQNPIATIACQANLSNSDKDIIGLNGSPIGTNSPCNGSSDAIPTSIAFKTGDVVTFEINICNVSGTAPAKAISVVDNLVNLTKPTAGWNMLYNDGSGNVAVSPINEGGTDPNKTLSFTIPNVPVGTYAKITFNAVITAPPGLTNGSSRFINSAQVTYTGGPAIPIFTTGSHIFSIGPTDPTIHEQP